MTALASRCSGQRDQRAATCSNTPTPSRFSPPSDLPGARTSRGDGVYGSPARVAEDIAALDRLGLGGIIAVFRMGPMPHALATQNLELFMRQVAPQFRS